jgi:hypothetical protein
MPKLPKSPKFHETLDPDFKASLVNISKLICEVWLDEPRGKKFQDTIESRRDVKLALNQCGIPLPEEGVIFQLDTSTYNGSIEIEEDLKRGLTFLWKLPYAAWPEKGIKEEEIKDWINTCDQWLEDFKSNPGQDFPIPKNIYLPLATF